MKPFDKLTSRLRGVKFARPRNGGRRALACCPVHDDHNPSVSIDELPDGRILFKCQSQHCANNDIIAAVGITWPELYPDNLRIAPVGRKGRGAGQAEMSSLISANEVAEGARFVLLCAASLRLGETLDEGRMLQLAGIAGRLAGAEVVR